MFHVGRCLFVRNLLSIYVDIVYCFVLEIYCLEKFRQVRHEVVQYIM